MQPNDHESEHPDHRADEPPVKPSLEPESSVVPEPQPTQNEQAANEEAPAPANLRRRVDDIRTRIKWLFVLNVVVAIGTALQACFAYQANQWTRAAINKNEELTLKALKQNADLTDKALAQNKLLNDQILAQSKTISDQTLALNKELTEASLNETRSGTDVARQSAINSQRAWVGVAEPMTPFEVTLGPPWYRLRFEASIKNFGQSPAFRVTTIMLVATSFNATATRQAQACQQADEWHVRSYESVRNLTGDRVQGRTLFPDDRQNVMADSSVDSGSVTDELTYILGCTVYTDIFRAKRRTRFCYASRVSARHVNNKLPFMPCWMLNDAE